MDGVKQGRSQRRFVTKETRIVKSDSILRVSMVTIPLCYGPAGDNELWCMVCLIIA